MNFSKRVGYIVTLLVFLLSTVLIFAKEASDEIILDKYQDKVPPVLFKHKKHVDEIKVKCAACHHEKPEEPSSCFSCHKEKKEGDAVKAKDAFHKLCVVCHKEKKGGELSPPVKCKKCHVKEAPKAEPKDEPEETPGETPEETPKEESNEEAEESKK